MIETPPEELNPNISAPPSKALWHVVLLLVLLGIYGSFAGALTGEKTTFLLKEQLHMTPSDIGTLFLVLGIPAYLQPFMGAWFDLFPLFGYHRRSYYVLGKLMGVIALGVLAMMQQYHLVVVGALLMFSGVGGVIRGVIINAVTVGVGNLTGTFGRLLSLSSFIPLVLSIVYTAHFQGMVTQNWSYARAYGTAAILAFLVIPLVLLIDERAVAGRAPAISPEELEEQKREKEADRARTRAALRDATRKPSLWVMVAYVFYLIITPGINTVQTFYMTDVLHISKQVIGDLGAYNSGGALAGIALFALFSRRIPVRAMVWGAWLGDCLSYPVLLLLHDATSAKWLAVFGGIVGILYSFSLFTLAARMCPPGIEGAIYGLIQSAIALAGAFSEKFGGWLYVHFGPLNPAHHYTIQHGWTMSLLVGLGFTLIAVVFIPFLPAWTRSNEPIHGSANANGRAPAGTEPPPDIPDGS